MKSFRINQEEMLSHDSIEQSFLKPSRGKRNRADVKKVLDNLENEIAKVQTMLYTGTFKPSQHSAIRINEKNYLKERTIVKPNYKYEQVVHHVAVQAIRPGVENGLYEYVMGSIPGRGQHKGAKRIAKWIREDPVNTKYVLKMDIRHFFESVDHDVLKAWLTKKFRDEYILELLFLIIDAIDMGLPLGYYTSQWFANFLLQPLDHYIKEELHVKYDMRFMDDIVCFGRNKKELHKVRLAISEYLENELHLELKGNWQVFRFEYEVEEYAIQCVHLSDLENLGKDLEKLRIRYKSKMHKGHRKIFVKVAAVRTKTMAFESILKKYNATHEKLMMTYGRPLDFMGFELHRNKTIMRESIMLRLTKKALQISKQEKINPKDASSLLSSLGWVDCTDTYAMYEVRVKPYVEVKKLKKIVSKHQRRLNERDKAKLEKGRRNSGGATEGTGNNQKQRVSQKRRDTTPEG